MDGVTLDGLGADDAGEAVRHAQAELERAVREGNLAKGPMRLPLGALAVTLGAQHQLHLASVRQLRDVVSTVERQVSVAIDSARQPVDPAAIARLEAAAVSGADRRAAALARAHNRRTLLIAVAALVGGMSATGAGGYWAGHDARLGTEAGIVAEAFRDGPAAADAWFGILRSNSASSVMAACTGKAVVTVGGRRACGVGLWLDPMQNGAPQTANAR